MANIPNIPSDWGSIKLEKITESSDFWALFDELVDDKSGFFHNRSSILDAYKNGMLYGLSIVETDSMYKRGAGNDSLFCKNSLYMLPCFCIKKEPDCCDMLWVHTRARRLDFGSELVRLLGITKVDNVLDTSIGFWDKCGVDLSNVCVTKTHHK